mmetsp:Transcript_13806/g.12240  ORF Transcript_13806/g.12240 Transcript_13806/m.12240 type:complete len:141 (-) Transcript_13806:477-899(-)
MPKRKMKFKVSSRKQKNKRYGKLNLSVNPTSLRNVHREYDDEDFNPGLSPQYSKQPHIDRYQANRLSMAAENSFNFDTDHYIPQKAHHLHKKHNSNFQTPHIENNINFPSDNRIRNFLNKQPPQIQSSPEYNEYQPQRKI